MQGHGGLVGRVDEIVSCGCIVPCRQILNCLGIHLVRRQNVHIDILPIAAVPVVRVVFGGNLHGKTLALIIRLIRGVGFRELIAIRILSEDDGFPDYGRIRPARNAFAAGIENQAVGIRDGLPHQVSGFVGSGCAKDCSFTIQRPDFKYCAEQGCVTGDRIPNYLLQIHRGDDGFIYHGQNGVIEVRGFTPLAFQCRFAIPRPDIELGYHIAILYGGAEQLEVDIICFQITHRCLLFMEGVDGVLLQGASGKLIIACRGSPVCNLGTRRSNSLVDFQHSAGEGFAIQALLIAGLAVTLNVIALGNGDHRFLVLHSEVQGGMFSIRR